jgi:type IV secretory pathway VirB4 component
VPAHRVTTAHLQAAYPFIAEGGLGSRGAYIGRDLFGGSFCFDPWELYAAGVLTNPNILVIGAIGSRKSTLVKTLLYRQYAFGRRAWIADPKGEYGPLAAACGAQVIRQAPGLGQVLNPLDAAVDAGRAPAEVAQRRLELLQALLATTLGRDLAPVESAACDLALAAITATVPTLPAVAAALLDPDRASAVAVRMTEPALAEATRDIALALRRLCTGDLAGMFDGPTNMDVDLDGPMVVLDLSEVYTHHGAALPLVMTCATAWLQATMSVSNSVPRVQRFHVNEEAWATLSSVSLARWQQQSYKLARQHGVANIAVLHRLSDLTAAGAAGSEQVALARGLLEDAGTRVIYAQPHGEIKAARELLGLADTEAELLPQLPAGTALWKVGRRSFIVEHRLGARERTIVDTDAAMRADRR